MRSSRPGSRPASTSTRLAADALRLGDRPAAPDHLREHAQRACLAAAIAELAIALERALLRGGGGVDLIREIALLRVTLEQRGQLGRRQAAREAHGARVLRGGLAMRALRGRAGAGRRRMRSAATASPAASA